MVRMSARIASTELLSMRTELLLLLHLWSNLQLCVTEQQIGFNLRYTNFLES